MNSLIFQTAAKVLLPVMLVLSVVVLLRGHNEPGGGFVGGLLAASAFSLYALSHGAAEARRVLRINPITLIGLGLVIAVLSGVPAFFQAEPFLKGLWVTIPLPGFDDPIKFGTPVVFDVGVMMIVLGGTLLMAITLEELRHEPAIRG